MKITISPWRQSEYKAADTFDRVVGTYIEIDFIFNDITAQIVVAKSLLMRFVAMLPNDNT